MKVVTLFDETLRFVSLQTKKCHVQHTVRMEPYAHQTLCGLPTDDDPIVRYRREIAADLICGRCIRVLNAYYTELPGQPGKGKRARIGELEASAETAQI